MKKFSFSAKVWRWPGDPGWYFVNLPKELFNQIRGKYKKGMVGITATVGKTSWDTALFPHVKSGTYLLSVKKIVRKKEGIYENDNIKISFVLKK